MKHIEFYVLVTKTVVPAGPDWLHEIKCDGYRVRLERDGDRVRLLSKGGDDWANRYPWIVETARNIRQSRFILDGEAVVLGVDGISDFNALHSRKVDHEVQLYAFDILALGGDDIRRLPLSIRKQNLARSSCAGGRRASSWRRSSTVRSGRNCSRLPTAWGSRVWSLSTASAPTRSAGAITGSR
ncbi:hypothetical protein Q3C01_41600 [Bradyrhizobium sp. UFLA05-109]